MTATEDTFLKTLEAATEEKYRGWMILSVHDKIGEGTNKSKPFPFDLGTVLPWWDKTNKIREEREVDGTPKTAS